MFRSINLRFLCLTLLLFGSVTLHAQNKKDLEDKKNKLKEDIEYKNKLLQETKKNKQLSLNQLVILNKKISIRQELINTIQRETQVLGKKIDENQLLIASMENDLKQLKDEYAKMIIHAWQNRNAYDRLMFLFASEDFNQAYKRLKYFQQYSEYRQRQAEMIQKTQEILNQKNQELQAIRLEKQNLLQKEEQQKVQLAQEKQQKQSTFSNLQTQEDQLKQEIKKKEQEAAKLQKAIERIIEEEIRKKGKNYFALTPEAIALSDNFSGNKGKFPWPVIKGVITEVFGEHAHPVLKQVKVKNNGVNISTEKGGKARAVFEGEVSRVITITGSGKAVIIRHGEFLTVYSNLKEVYVKTGDKITTKQELGEIIHDDADGKTELHFELWKGKTILDPADWLYQAK